MSQSNTSSNDAEDKVLFKVGLPYPRGQDVLFLPVDPKAKSFQRDATVFELSSGGKTLDLGPGLHLAVARTGVGKTTLLKNLCALHPDDFSYINLLEPFNDEAERAQPMVTYSLKEAIEVSALLCANGVVPVLDSLRVLTYTSSGATGKRGVNMSMFVYLTALSNTLARAGCTMIASINPLLDEAEDYNFFLENCRSAVSGVMEVTSKTGLQYKGRPDRARVINFNLSEASIKAGSAQLATLSLKANAIASASDFARATRPRLAEVGKPSVGRTVKGQIATLN